MFWKTELWKSELGKAFYNTFNCGSCHKPPFVICAMVGYPTRADGACDSHKQTNSELSPRISAGRCQQYSHNQVLLLYKFNTGLIDSKEFIESMCESLHMSDTGL